ncbi:hypothetical protein JCM10213_002295 [Rhodosporidiobolus nylandii]
MPSLLDLPPELVDQIVEMVHTTHPKQYLGSIHRAFLPISRRLFFRNLVVTSFVRLDRLCDLLRQGEAVAQSVARLELNLTGADPGLPSSADVAALLESLPSLRVLEVPDNPRILDIATNPTSSKRKSLQELFLQFSPAPHFSPFHPEHFRRLPLSQNLHTLSLRAKSSMPPPSITLAAAPPLTNLVALSLQGRLLDDPAVPLLIAACPHLNNLGLFQDNTIQKGVCVPFDVILDAVANAALRRLSILDNGNYRHIELCSALERFTELDGLALGHGCACVELVSSLHNFPLLSTIIFHPGADITTDGILPLLEPTTKPPSLRTLEVDKVKPSVARQNVAYDWSPSFSKAGVAALLAAADKAGVELSGYCVDVVRAEREAAPEATEEKAA